MTITPREEAQALIALQQQRSSGRLDTPLAEPLAHRLVSERYALEDANGSLMITERGAQRLSGLKRAGALKAGRSEPRVRFADRRGPR